MIEAQLNDTRDIIAKQEEILKRLVADLPQVECQSFHHLAKDRHTDFTCPICIRWQKAVDDAKRLLTLTP